MNTKLNQILAEISVGELMDKITILEIKKEKIKDKEKLKHIEKELASLNITSNDKIPDKTKIQNLITNLKNVNLKLWDIEEGKDLLKKVKNLMKDLLNSLGMFINLMMKELK